MQDNRLKYDRNMPYNHLPLLPPPDEKIITIELLKAINKANKAVAELKGLAQKLPNQTMLINTIVLREAKASSEIENIFTTDDELYKAFASEDDQLKGNTKEVFRYRQALWLGFKNIKEKKKIDTNSLINIYREIKQANDGIRPPQTETVIKKRGSGLLGGSVVYTPPRGEKIINQKLDNLLDYINDDSTYDYDPLIKLAVAHYQFEAIHPFRDGNGRVGRIMSILILNQKQLLNFPIIYLSAYIIAHKDKYYELLNKVTTLQWWGEWLKFMLNAIEETAIYTIQKINEIDHLFNSTSKLINQKLPHIRKETIEQLFEQPYIAPKNLVGSGIKSVNTAKKYCQQMESLGILASEKVGKQVIYINVDLFNLLADT